MWLSPSGQVAHTILDWRLCRPRIFMKEQTQVYHYMNPSKNTPHFKPLLNGKHLCVVQFRVLKIKTAPNTFEYIITNLPFSFDINDIKICYRLC